MNKEIIQYIKQNYPESAIFKDDVQSGYLVFCDETGQQYQPYKINDENVVFVVPEDEWDDNGWIDEKGFSFRAITNSTSPVTGRMVWRTESGRKLRLVCCGTWPMITL